MIDASSFALHHIAFWTDHAPTTEHFVRRINLEHSERWSAPLDKPREKIRAAYVAELAFSRFCIRQSGIEESEIAYLATLEAKKRLFPLLENPSTLEDPLSKSEEGQVIHLENSLQTFFKSRNMHIITRPIFYGCGYIDSSEGDILSGNCIFEVKTVDRPFRGGDIKQLITYCALNHFSSQFSLKTIGIFNPRRGTYFEMSLDKVSFEIAGKSKQELFDGIGHAISSGDISR